MTREETRALEEAVLAVYTLKGGALARLFVDRELGALALRDDALPGPSGSRGWLSCPRCGGTGALLPGPDEVRPAWGADDCGLCQTDGYLSARPEDHPRRRRDLDATRDLGPVLERLVARYLQDAGVLGALNRLMPPPLAVATSTPEEASRGIMTVHVNLPLPTAEFIELRLSVPPGTELPSPEDLLDAAQARPSQVEGRGEESRGRERGREDP